VPVTETAPDVTPFSVSGIVTSEDIVSYVKQQALRWPTPEVYLREGTTTTEENTLESKDEL